MSSVVLRFLSEYAYRHAVGGLRFVSGYVFKTCRNRWVVGRGFSRWKDTFVRNESRGSSGVP